MDTRNFTPSASLINRWMLVGCLSLAAACSSDVGSAMQSASGTCPPGTSAACGSMSVPTSSATAGSAPNSSASSNPAGMNAGAVLPPAPSSEGVPCNVAQVVTGHCTQCHGAVPTFGAPMSLMKMADFHAVAKSDPARKVYEVIPERINAQELARRMPPSPSMALVDLDRQALGAWASAGANAVSDQCAITETPIGNGSTMGAAPIANPTTGISTTPVEYNDPNLMCFKLLAHAQGSTTEKYTVSTQPDLLVSFNFMPPWGTEMRYVRAMKAIIDEKRVVHHWLLYRTSRAGMDGSVVSSTGVHPDGLLMHGWAPGGNDLYFREDLGQEMPGDVAYALEFHYNNASGGPLPDASGIEVCVTTTMPEHVLGNSWLGTDRLGGTTATGTCDPTTRDPIQILAVQPHMHKSGMHFKAVINRAGGMAEMMHDEAFSFDDQRYYIFETELKDGDTITSTCSFSQPATYGSSTNTEMCYLYVLYYPRLALTNGSPLNTSLHGPDTCLE